MKRFRIIIACLLLCVPLVVRAQALCDFLPCGPIPWSIPNLPVLQSPSPMPTVVLTTVPTATSGPTPTSGAGPTPAPTGTVFSDFSSLGNQLNTLQAVVGATSVPVMVSGTPVSSDSSLATTAANAGSFFGYVRGFSEVDLGGLTPFIAFIFSSFAVVLAVKSLGLILPVLTTVFGIIFQIAQFIIGLFKA